MFLGHELNKFWNTLSQTAKVGFVSGVVLIVAFMAVAGFWIFRVDFQVLFADLKPQDSAVMVAELDRLKVPYKIADSGTTILVEKELVHSTRLKLLGKELPLHGAVGLELFNNSDFGMTEFAQKINYQRALQGELIRTISSLDEVADVRVHLALPEEGLFKRATNKAKAAITLSLKPGSALRSEQVTGIQRLVAAAVPGILAQDVTIVDKQGVALTKSTGIAEQDLASASLELKRDTENMLLKKVNAVLRRTFDSEEVSASVDVILNLDQIKVTTEDVLAAPNESGQATGVVVKDKESTRDMSAPIDAVAGGAGGKSANSTREIEYQVGRRIEQMVSQPGAIKRLSAVAVVHRDLTDEQREQVKNLVAAAVGAVPARGDNIVVQSMIRGQLSSANSIGEPTPPKLSENLGQATVVPNKIFSQETFNPNWVVVGVLVFFLILVLVFSLMRVIKPRSDVRKLSDAERAEALRKVRSWMDGTHQVERQAGEFNQTSGDWLQK